MTGLVATSAVIDMLVGSLILGHLTDKLGRRAMYVFELIFFVVFAVLTALSQNVWELLIFRFLLGIGAGFETVDHGRVALGGQDITHWVPQKRQMGMVFRSYALFPNLTAFDNIAFGLRIRRTPRDATQNKVQELLELVGLGEKGQRFPHQPSGGEQQRVALARALGTWSPSAALG